MSMFCILFLDVDGVLKTRKTIKNFWTLEDDLVARLQKVLLETDARICLSTTWRLQKQSADVLMKELERCGVDLTRIIGETPEERRTRSNPNPKRTDEIRSWLLHQQLDTRTPWVAVDDMDLMAQNREYMQGHFVRTSEPIGLTDNNVTEIIDMFKAHEYYFATQQQNPSLPVQVTLSPIRILYAQHHGLTHFIQHHISIYLLYHHSFHLLYQSSCPHLFITPPHPHPLYHSPNPRLISIMTIYVFRHYPITKPIDILLQAGKELLETNSRAYEVVVEPSHDNKAVGIILGEEACRDGRLRVLVDEVRSGSLAAGQGVAIESELVMVDGIFMSSIDEAVQHIANVVEDALDGENDGKVRLAFLGPKSNSCTVDVPHEPPAKLVVSGWWRGMHDTFFAVVVDGRRVLQRRFEQFEHLHRDSIEFSRLMERKKLTFHSPFPHKALVHSDKVSHKNLHKLEQRCVVLDAWLNELLDMVAGIKTLRHCWEAHPLAEFIAESDIDIKMGGARQNGEIVNPRASRSASLPMSLPPMLDRAHPTRTPPPMGTINGSPLLPIPSIQECESEDNVCCSPTSAPIFLDNIPKMQGYLEKIPMSLAGNQKLLLGNRWKKRYFVLEESVSMHTFKLSYYANGEDYLDGRPPKGMVLLLPGFTSVGVKYGHTTFAANRGRAASDKEHAMGIAVEKSLDILETAKTEWTNTLDSLKASGKISEEVYLQLQDLYSITDKQDRWSQIAPGEKASRPLSMVGEVDESSDVSSNDVDKFTPTPVKQLKRLSSRSVKCKSWGHVKHRFGKLQDMVDAGAMEEAVFRQLYSVWEDLPNTRETQLEKVRKLVMKGEVKKEVFENLCDLWDDVLHCEDENTGQTPHEKKLMDRSSFLPSCLPACLPICLHSFLSSFLPSCLPSCLSYFLFILLFYYL
jgi:hypothetical protein